MKMKYSLFLLTKTPWSGNPEDCCIYLKTFDTLEEAKAEQKEYMPDETIILPSY